MTFPPCVGVQGVYIADAVNVVKRELALECDYDLEIASQKRFKDLVSGDPTTATQFNVPEVFPHLSSQRVLTTEWVHGVSIDKVRHAWNLCNLTTHADWMCVSDSRMSVSTPMTRAPIYSLSWMYAGPTPCATSYPIPLNVLQTHAA